MSNVIQAAQELVPSLMARSEEIEKNRFLPPDISADFARRGFYRLCVPQCYGGLEASPLTMLEVIETLATADGAAAWCVFIGATSGYVATFLTPDVAREVYGNADGLTVGVVAPRGTARRVREKGVDGFCVSGRWQWGSGIRNAQWVMGGATVMGEHGPEQTKAKTPHNRLMIIRTEQAEIIDTWHSVGLCGTGSNDFAMQDVFVPEAFSADVAFGKPVETPLYAFPQFGLLALGIVGVSFGLARRALQEIISLAGKKTPEGAQSPLALRSHTQASIAKAEALVSSARAYVRSVVATAWDKACRDGVIDVSHRRDIRLACTHGVEAATQAIDMVTTLAGGSSVYRSNPLQRIFRDAHVATQHMMVGAPTYALAGRAFLGLPSPVHLL